MPIEQMTSVWYPVTDWSRAKAFYSDVLGLKLDACSDDAGWAALHSGATPFFLVRKPEREGGGSGGVVGFEATEIEDILARVREFGCVVASQVQDGPNVRIFTVFDPDGNALELTERRVDG